MGKKKTHLPVYVHLCERVKMNFSCNALGCDRDGEKR
jgi:hypothetical protein